jgi:hypothetical protein
LILEKVFGGGLWNLVNPFVFDLELALSDLAGVAFLSLFKI